jgi:hypothetical protein
MILHFGYLKEEIEKDLWPYMKMVSAELYTMMNYTVCI